MNLFMATPVWVVRDVKANEDYTLFLTFANGEQRIYNAKPLLEKKIYEDLKNVAFFLSAKAECGTVVWSDDIDIAPEHLYECSVLMEGK
jgi:hypothetical protein